MTDTPTPPNETARRVADADVPWIGRKLRFIEGLKVEVTALRRAMSHKTEPWVEMRIRKLEELIKEFDGDA